MPGFVGRSLMSVPPTSAMHTHQLSPAPEQEVKNVLAGCTKLGTIVADEAGGMCMYHSVLI